MKIKYRIIFILIILFSTNFYAQKIDSIILKSNFQKIRNPKIKYLDSLHKKFNKTLNKLLEKGYLVSTNEYKSPTFYHVKSKGNQIPLNNFLYEQLKTKTNSFKAYFKIEIEWNGQINYISLVGYTGNIDNIDFISLWKNIKAKPATEFNIPITSIVSVPIIKTNDNK